MRSLQIDQPMDVWRSAEAATVDEFLRKDGAVVIDGEGICDDISTFQRFADMLCGPLSRDNTEHDRIEEDPTSTVNRPIMVDGAVAW